MKHIRHLQSEIEALEKRNAYLTIKITQLGIFHDDWDNWVRERNVNRIKVATKKKVIQNLRKGKPSHGYPDNHLIITLNSSNK